jgi:hypothetical protein
LEQAADEHSQHAGHGSHEMTNEQIGILKSKIELYRPYSNEQINAAMARKYDAHDYLSEPALMRDVGVPALGHGYKAEGAKTIVVLPTEIGDNTSLIRQWEYALGLRDTSSCLDVARIRTAARVIIAKTPTTSPVVTTS